MRFPTAGNGWSKRSGSFLKAGVTRLRGLRGGIPGWTLKWGLNILFILLIFKGYHVAVGMLQSPELQLKQAMFPSGLSGPVAVSAQAAEQRDLVRSVVYPGTVAPDEEIPVYARVEGWVLSIGPREGDAVRDGEVLARLDTTQLAPEVQQHESAVAAAEAAYDQHQIAISGAKADLADALAKQSYWASEFERDKALYQAGGISASEFDQAKASYASAQARVAAVREQIAAQVAATQMARHQVRVQQAGLAMMETTLGYATVTAPQSGVVTARLVDPGTLVRPGQSLLKTARMGSVRVRVQVAQEDAPDVRVGAPAMIQFAGLPDPVRARVTRVFPQQNPQIRTTTVEMLIPNPGERIKLDMYASVTLDLAVHKHVVAVPSAAVVPVNGTPTVFVVVNGNTAHAQPVTTGITADPWVEVIRGIKPGDMVVTDGNRGLVDGQAVTVTNL